MKTGIACLVSTLSLAGAARATECGEARAAAAHFRAAVSFEDSVGHKKEAAEAKSKLKSSEAKIKTACAPRKVTIAALPLGYVALPPGNLSRATVEPGESWRLTLTTLAGAPSGIVFAEPATLALPAGWKWETELAASKLPNELLVAVATDATLTVDEPEVGRGRWSLAVKSKPQLYPMSKLRSCAAGTPGLNGLNDQAWKLSRAACEMLLAVDPIAEQQALPERGRGVFVGEWQYGWNAAIELGAEAFVAQPGEPPAPPRIDLTLELSASIPGVSDGKKLIVTVEANGQDAPTGGTYKLGHGCGGEDEACEKERFTVEVWYDRAFGVPFLRLPPAGAAQARLSGKVTDRLARPIKNQRVLLTTAGRRAVTITDEQGDYRFDGLQAGDATLVPCGKNPANVPTGDESRQVKLGLGETKVPVIYLNKLWE